MHRNSDTQLAWANILKSSMHASVVCVCGVVAYVRHSHTAMSMDSSSTTIRNVSSQPSSALPSPPDSPSSDSVSSLPSVSSSFFFSSAAASPPHSHSEHARDSTQALIIPSLTLPSALRRPTPYGQTLGELKLLVLGSQGTGKSFLSGLLVDGNEDVVDVGTWEETEHGALLRASTDWIEYRDGHGLEKFEPARNVEIIELPGYEHSDDVSRLFYACSQLQSHRIRRESSYNH